MERHAAYRGACGLVQTDLYISVSLCTVQPCVLKLKIRKSELLLLGREHDPGERLLMRPEFGDRGCSSLLMMVRTPDHSSPSLSLCSGVIGIASRVVT